MLRSEKSREKMEKILGDRNISLLETNRQNKTNFVSAGNRLAHIE